MKQSYLPFDSPLRPLRASLRKRHAPVQLVWATAWLPEARITSTRSAYKNSVPTVVEPVETTALIIVSAYWQRGWRLKTEDGISAMTPSPYTFTNYVISPMATRLKREHSLEPPP